MLREKESTTSPRQEYNSEWDITSPRHRYDSDNPNNLNLEQISNNLEDQQQDFMSSPRNNVSSNVPRDKSLKNSPRQPRQSFRIVLTRTYQIPEFVQRLIEEIRLRALKTEGIFRVSCEVEVIWNEKEKIEKQTYDFKSIKDVHVLCGLLKEYYRDCWPMGLIPGDIYDMLLAMIDIEDVEARKFRFLKILSYLPTPNLMELYFLCDLLHDVVLNSEYNKMRAQNISICFGPTIIRSPHSVPSSTNNIMVVMKETSKASKAIELLVDKESFHWFFEPVKQQQKKLKNRGVVMSDASMVTIGGDSKAFMSSASGDLTKQLLEFVTIKNDMMVKQDELKELENRLKDWEQGLTEREGELSRREQHVAQKESEIQLQLQELELQCQDLEQHQNDLEQSRKELEQQKKDLEQQKQQELSLLMAVSKSSGNNNNVTTAQQSTKNSIQQEKEEISTNIVSTTAVSAHATDGEIVANPAIKSTTILASPSGKVTVPSKTSGTNKPAKDSPPLATLGKKPQLPLLSSSSSSSFTSNMVSNKSINNNNNGSSSQLLSDQIVKTPNLSSSANISVGNNEKSSIVKNKSLKNGPDVSSSSVPVTLTPSSETGKHSSMDKTSINVDKKNNNKKAEAQKLSFTAALVPNTNNFVNSSNVDTVDGQQNAAKRKVLANVKKYQEIINNKDNNNIAATSSNCSGDGGDVSGTSPTNASGTKIASPRSKKQNQQDNYFSVTKKYATLH